MRTERAGLHFDVHAEGLIMKMTTIATGAALALLVPTLAGAAVPRETTTVKLDRPVRASGKVLAAGEYSLERVDANVVAVLKDGRFVTFLRGEPVTRAEDGPTVVTLRKAGAASQLHRWFVHGERTGLEFGSVAKP